VTKQAVFNVRYYVILKTSQSKQSLTILQLVKKMMQQATKAAPENVGEYRPIVRW